MDVPTQESGNAARAMQPLLHDLVTLVDSPAVALSARDGLIREGGVQGLFVDDIRRISFFDIRMAGTGLEHVATSQPDAGRVSFAYVARGLGDKQPDPTVWLTVDRRLQDGRCEHRITVTSAARQPVHGELSVDIRSDAAPMGVVRSGGQFPALPAGVLKGGDGFHWGGKFTVTGSPAPAAAAGGTMTWAFELATDQSWTATVVAGPPNRQSPPKRTQWADVRLSCSDVTFRKTFERSISDLEALRTDVPGSPDEAFLAAGSPWYLTLFGRDSLWAARFMLPFGTANAMDTLRALARYQGTTTDPATAEEPGKILHELRHESAGGDLPPVFYGSSDATPLWICLLAEAWQWGAPEEEVRALIPALSRALTWLRDCSDHDGDGFIDYSPIEGIGPINQGWKDSPDCIHDARGNLAEGTVVLAEMQAYAVDAALAGATLLDHFSLPGGAAWRDWAETLRSRFRRSFWTRDTATSFPALALDSAGRSMDALTSNLGHLLGTGLLTPAEEATVAELLGSPGMLSAFGLRTLTAESPRYNPLSYHNGSVWPHDNAIAIRGLAAAGHPGVALSITKGLVSAAEAFDHRLPELWGSTGLPAGHSPLPYPAACRPQAWSAAAPAAMLAAMLGLGVDAQTRTLTLAPVRPFPFGATELHGIVLGTARVSVTVDAQGNAGVAGLPGDWTLEPG